MCAYIFSSSLVPRPSYEKIEKGSGQTCIGAVFQYSAGPARIPLEHGAYARLSRPFLDLFIGGSGYETNPLADIKCIHSPGTHLYTFSELDNPRSIHFFSLHRKIM